MDANRQEEPTQEIYLCEVTRKISKINSQDSEICNQSDYMSYGKYETFSLFRRDTPSRDNNCSSKNNCLESIQDDSIKKFDAEIDVSLTTWSERRESLSLQSANVTNVFPKGLRAIATNVMDTETKSQIGLQKNPEVALVNSVTEDVEKMSKLASRNNTINNEHFRTESVAYFETTSPNLSNIKSHNYDLVGTNCGDRENCGKKLKNLRDVTSLNEVLIDIIIPTILKSQQFMLLSLDKNECLEINTKRFSKKDEEKENACSLEIMKTDNTRKGIVEREDNSHLMDKIPLKDNVLMKRNIGKKTDKNVIEVLKKQARARTESDSSSHYETCSSVHLKRKLKKHSFIKKNERIISSQSPKNKNINSCKCEAKFKQVQLNSLSDGTSVQDQQFFDIESDSSVDYFSLESNEIIIPVPNMKTLKNRNLIMENKQCNNQTICKENHFNKISEELRKKRGRKKKTHSINTESLSKQLEFHNVYQYLSKCILTKNTVQTHRTSSLSSRKRMIDYLLEKAIHTSIASAEAIGEAETNINTDMMQNSQIQIEEGLTDIWNSTWKKMKSISTSTNAYCSALTDKTTSTLSYFLNLNQR